MVRYTISFLISFKKFGDDDVQRTTETSIDIPTQPDLAINEEETLPSYHLFRPNADTRKICNIIYSLPTFGGNFMECQISVACWSKIFKVYSKKHDAAFKTEQYGDNTWAAFTIQHIYDEDNFEVSDLKTFYSKSIEFRFSDDPRYLLKRAHTEKLGMYWCHYKSEDIGAVFEPLEQLIEPNAGGSSAKNNTSTANSSTGRSTKSTKSLKFRKLLATFSEPVLRKRVHKIHMHRLMKTMKNLENDCITSSDSILQLPGSYLFLDKPVWIIQNGKPLSSNIKHMYVFLSTYSFVDENARMALYPFTIILESLKNLPKEELRSKGLKQLCVEYELDPIIPKTRTKFEHWNGEDKLLLRSINCFLTDNFHPLTIISTLQTKKLIVRILGKRLISSEPAEIRCHRIFGSDLYDERFSSSIKAPLTCVNVKPSLSKNSSSPKAQKHTKKIPTSINSIKSSSSKPKSESRKDDKLAEALLGMAQIDLSPLVLGRSCVLAYQQVSSEPYVTHHWGTDWLNVFKRRMQLRTLPSLCHSLQLQFNAPNPKDIFIHVHKDPCKIFQDRNQTEDELFGHFNINEAHTDHCNYERYLLSNSSLMCSCTVVKITAKCGYLLTPNIFKEKYSLDEAYSRAIAIITDIQFAADILKSVLKSNSEALDMGTYNLPLVPLRKMFEVPNPIVDLLSTLPLKTQDYSTVTCEVDFEDENQSTKVQNTVSWFTGFCIDCVDKVIMFIEGPTVNAFPDLLTWLVNIKPDQGKIMYSSDLIYDSRFYAIFKELGGIYCITMKRPVKDLVKMESTLCCGYAIPEPARKALNKISKLISSKTVLEVVQENYLPQPNQLISFDIEFGLPHCIQT